MAHPRRDDPSTTGTRLRRIRPSNRDVLRALTTGTTTRNPNNVPRNDDSGTNRRCNTGAVLAAAVAPTVYKIVTEDGQERRMTSQEKRHAKWQAKQQAKKRKEQAAASISDQSYSAGHYEAITNVAPLSSLPPSLNPPEQSPSDETLQRIQPILSDDSDRYYVWPMSSAAATANARGSASLDLEMELADLRGERDGVPPVMLSPALSRLVQVHYGGDGGLESARGGGNSPSGTVGDAATTVRPDDDAAQQWASALAASMTVAESVRQAEVDWRPMPYRLVPEVWQRLRPAVTKSSYYDQDTAATVPTDPAGSQSTTAMEPARPTKNDDLVATMSDANHPRSVPATNPRVDYAYCPMRPSSHWNRLRQGEEAAILQLLHRDTHLHISCGAKFGCDYLLYDGPRTERHAFAGLRILLARAGGGGGPFPLPTAYDLAGYVRCLNTAGKLALIATVIRDDADDNADNNRPRLRVLLVDLALVKIASTTSKRPRKTMEQRIKNLAKSK
jgi:hypothetical protein